MPDETQSNESFIAMLLGMSSGAVAADCSRRMREVIAASRDTGKGGSLTLTLHFKPVRVDDGFVKTMELSHKLSIKKPQHDSGKTSFYLTDDGELSTTDPEQAQLDLQPAAEPEPVGV